MKLLLLTTCYCIQYRSKYITASLSRRVSIYQSHHSTPNKLTPNEFCKNAAHEVETNVLVPTSTRAAQPAREPRSWSRSHAAASGRQFCCRDRRGLVHRVDRSPFHAVSTRNTHTYIYAVANGFSIQDFTLHSTYTPNRSLLSWSGALPAQQQQPFNGLCSGTTRVGRYQKKHSALA